MTAIHIGDAIELAAALKTATGGETFVLAGGDYGRLSLVDFLNTNIDFEAGLTFVAADPEDPPVFTAMSLYHADNITLDGLNFQYVAEEGAGVSQADFVATGCNSLTIVNSTFVGDEIAKYGVTDYAVGTGFKAVNCNDVTFTENTLRDLFRGAYFSGGDGITLSENDVHSMSGDGLGFTGVRNAEISDNYFHDFDIPDENTGHLDMIQFWVQQEGMQSENVLISGNVFDAGEGHSTQTIFMRNELANRTGDEADYYRNITITDNVIYNGHQHGIVVGETLGVTISNNTLLQNADYGDQGRVSEPLINVNTASQDVTITNNISHGIASELQDGWVVTNNLTVQRDDPGAANYYGNLFTNALADGGAELSDLAALPDSQIFDMGVGAEATRADYGSHITTSVGTGLDSKQFTFQVVTTDPSLGSVTNVSWQFSDGISTTGAQAAHRFVEMGDQLAVATVTYDSGVVRVIEQAVEVRSPLVVAISSNDSSGLDISSTPITESNTRLAGNDALTVNLAINTDGADLSVAKQILSISKVLKMVMNEKTAVFFLTTDVGVTQINVDVSSIGDGGWHDITATFSSETGLFSVYIDGSLEVARSGFAGHSLGGNGTLSLGSTTGSGFGGLIDNFSVLTAAVTEAADLSLLTNGDLSMLIDGPQTEIVTPGAPLPEFPGTVEDTPEVEGGEEVVTGSETVIAEEIDTTPSPILPVSDEPIFEQQEGLLFSGFVSERLTMRDSDVLIDVAAITLSFDFLNAADYDGAPENLATINKGLRIIKDDSSITVMLRTEDGVQTLRGYVEGLGDTEWHNVTVTYDAAQTTAIVYVDGSQIAIDTDLTGARLSNGGSPGLTLFPGGKSAFSGDMRDVVATSEILSADAVAQLAVTDVAAMLANPIEETPDSAGILLSDMALIIDDLEAVGILPNDGADAIMAGTFFQDMDAFTLSFDYEDAADYYGAPERILSIQNGLSLTKDGDGLFLSLTTDSGTRWFNVSDQAIGTDPTHNITMSYSSESAELKIYLDGETILTETNLAQEAIRGSLSGLKIGDDSLAEYSGMIEDLFFTREALDDAEINLLANADLPATDLIAFASHDAGVMQDHWIL